MKIFAEITKVDQDKRLVYGYASTEAMDSQGEKISKDALETALPDYMKFANIREMHQPSAVGVAQEAELDEKGLYLCAKVVDAAAWEKVKEGVYKGFSIGGKKVEKIDDTITNLRLTEISLVDRPANPECVFDVFKADDEPVNDDALAKYIGEEAWDASRALMALSEIYALYAKELQENHPEAAGQLASLETVINGLKAFIASEIMEKDPAGDDAEAAVMAMADNDNDIEKAGARNAKADLSKIQTIHDHIVALGADCKGGAAKMATEEDLKKIEEMETRLAKVEGENAELKKIIDELKAQPAPAKGVLKAVDKGEDTGEPAKAFVPIKKADGSIDQQATALELTKAALSKGVQYLPGGGLI